jgi:hypothetical protein
MVVRRAVAWLTVALLVATGVPHAAVADETDAGTVVARLANDPRAPDAYSSNVELHVKLRIFPYFGFTFHGTSEYRRPGSYHFVLRGLPKLAAKFDDLRYELGDPLSWNERFDIAIAPQSTADAPVVRLTPKKPGLVAYLDVQSDADGGHIVRATWTRHDGGVIVLTQTYEADGKADVVVAQHATIDIPHMRADIDAHYANITLESPTLATVPAAPTP